MHQALLYKVASLYTATREDREDLIQEMVYQLWKSFPSFDARAQISTWMYRVALNVAIHALRQRQRRITALPLQHTFDKSDEPMDQQQEEQWQQLRTAMQHLSWLERGILMLHLERKSYSEIADIVGLSTSNIGTRLHRIRSKLRQRVNAKQ